MESAAGERRGRHEGKEEDQSVLLASKPLHRFIRGEPRSLGIVVGIFGCTELMMGFHLAGETMNTSYGIYIPFWQGVLFGVCGVLSIYTELHPSKKMVTVCLAMYVVSILGIIVSFGYRIFCFSYNSYMWYSSSHREGYRNRVTLLSGVEGLLFASSLCVSIILIFLSCIARLALKSTKTQIIVQHVAAASPPPDASS